mmetsp:Transcript_18281/g.56058  ORF Transcript_18281/g.56058 Transcript_18281/m.56058 type:complete len:595 (+) Transcript_18281:60-1844(+)
MTVPQAGGANFTTGLVYFIKAFVGPGCLSLPLAFQNSGLGLGLALLGGMGVIVTFNLRTMVLCKQHVTHKGVRTYADLTEEALGRTARRVVETLINGVQLGICAVYFDFFAENALAMLAKRFRTAENFYVCMVLVFPVYAALALLKSIDAIAPYAALANALVYAAIGVVLFAAVDEIHAIYFTHSREHGSERGHLEWFEPAKAPLFYSTAVYSFEGVCSLLPVENAMARPQQDMLPVTYAGMAVVTFTYAAVGAIAYAAWPDVSSGSITAEVNQNATNGLWLALALSANVATVIAVVLTFPVQLFPSIELLERTFGLVKAEREFSRAVVKKKRRVSDRSSHHWSPSSKYYEQCAADDNDDDDHHHATNGGGGHVYDGDDDVFDDDDDDDSGSSLKKKTTTTKGYLEAHEVATSGHVELAELRKDPESCPELVVSSSRCLRDDEDAKETPSSDEKLVRQRRLNGADEESGAFGATAVPHDDDDEWPLRRLLFRVGVVFLVGLVAALVPDLGDLIALIGALTGSALSLVTPALIDLSCPRPNRRKWEVPCDVLIILIGVVGGVAGTVQAVLNVVHAGADDIDGKPNIPDAVAPAAD